MPDLSSDFFPSSEGLGRPNLPPSKQERKAVRKLALKSMRRSLWGIAKGMLLHYGVTLAGVAVIAASGFHGVWRSALSATAIGLLARWFLPNQSRTLAAQQLYPQMELTPEQLREFMGKLNSTPNADETAAKISPYL